VLSDERPKFPCVIGALAAMRIPKREPKHARVPLSEFHSGLPLCDADLPIRSTLLLLSVLSLFGLQYAVFLPLFAKDILHSGARGFGLLMSSAGVAPFLGVALCARTD